MSAWIPLSILALVFVLIAVRQIGSIRLQLWHIMLGGALLVLVTGSITPLSAFHAINWEVILFLFCMFLIGYALEASGYLSQLAYHFFKRAKNADGLILLVLFGAGIASALLMNDTLAIIGTPVVLALAARHSLSPKLLLLALAFAITLGSTMSPIGNPQNLLIAVHGDLAFAQFALLIIPALLSMLVAYALLKFFYRDHFAVSTLFHTPHLLKDRKLALLCKMSLMLLLLLIFVKIVLVFLGIEFSLLLIAGVSVIPLLFSERRVEIVKRVDWHTLIFFAAMFILMQSVWDAGVFQHLLSGMDISAVGVVLLISIVVSQFISNVPLVALYLPVIGTSTTALLALAAGSTIAGSLFILGAASNIIIIQQAERRGETITFLEFARIGIPLTVLSAGIYWLCLLMLG